MTKLSYELCKKLKEAGFPQEASDYFWGYELDRNKPEICNRHSHHDDETYTHLCDLPDFASLIKACGDKFLILTRSPFTIAGPWRAEGSKSDDTWIEKHFGQTPEEAVANLYLELKNNS